MAHRRSAVPFALAGILVLSACGAGDRAGGTAGGAAGGGSDAGEAGVAPLAEFLGWNEVSTGLSDKEQQQERLVQDLVATCMRAQGFDYVPEDTSSGASGGDAGPFALPRQDFAAQYGYGVTTIDSEDLAKPEADPNQAIVDRLSPQANEAYTRALYGEAGARPLPGWIEPLPGAAPKGGPDTAPDRDAGCYQEAQDEVYGEVGAEPEGLAATFAELNEELSALQERIDRDPRVDAARTQWADCMADAGYSEFTSPNQPPQVLRERFREVTGLSGAPVDGRGPGVAQSAELLRLRDYERAVAQADLACRGRYDETVTQVRFELEEEFIADHRDLLERYRDLAGVAAGED